MKIFSNRNRLRPPLTWMAAVSIVTLAAISHARGPRASPVRRDHEVTTIRGKLEIQGIVSGPSMGQHQLTLDGKVTSVETEYGSVSIAASYPENAPARIVLLELSTGGSGCPSFYKVLEVKDDGSTVRSKEFGNCSPMARPSFVEGVLRVDIPKIGGAKAEAWHYKDGKLSKVSSSPRAR
jgi:hypothetical protein